MTNLVKTRASIFKFEVDDFSWKHKTLVVKCRQFSKIGTWHNSCCKKLKTNIHLTPSQFQKQENRYDLQDSQVRQLQVPLILKMPPPEIHRIISHKSQMVNKPNLKKPLITFVLMDFSRSCLFSDRTIFGTSCFNSDRGLH